MRPKFLNNTNDANTNQINFCPKVSNTSMGTDTDTQFLMSSDSGSKVQVQQAFFRERESRNVQKFVFTVWIRLARRRSRRS